MKAIASSSQGNLLRRLICWLRGHRRYIIVDWWQAHPELGDTVHCFRCGEELAAV